MVSYSSDAAGTSNVLPTLNIWEEALPTGHLTNPGSKPLGTERAKHYDASGILKTPIGLLRSHFTCLGGGRVEVQGLVPARAICGCTSPHVSAALLYTNTRGYRGFSGGKGSGHVDTTSASSLFFSSQPLDQFSVSHILLQLHTVESQYKKPPWGFSQGGSPGDKAFSLRP
jgi:hypothetical protein